MNRLWVILVFLVLSCSDGEKVDALGYSELNGVTTPVLATDETYDLVLDHDFRSPETDSDAILAGPSHFAGTPTGGTIVFDAASSSIINYDENGDIAWQVGENGSGPGQFTSPTGLAVSPLGDIFVTNSFGTRLDRFGANGVYLQSWGLSEYDLPNVQLAGFASDNSIVLYQYISKQYGATIHVVNIGDVLEIVRSFEYVREAVEFVPPEGSTMVPQVSVFGTTITVASIDSFRFAWFDLSGNKLDEYHNPDISVAGPLYQNRDGNWRGMSLSILNAPIKLSDDRWLLGGHWPNNVTSADEFFGSFSSGKPFPVEYHRQYYVYDAEHHTASPVAGDGLGSINRIFGGNGYASVYVAKGQWSEFGRYSVVEQTR